MPPESPAEPTDPELSPVPAGPPPAEPLPELLLPLLELLLPELLLPEPLLPVLPLVDPPLPALAPAVPLLDPLLSEPEPLELLVPPEPLVPLGPPEGLVPLELPLPLLEVPVLPPALADCGPAFELPGPCNDRSRVRAVMSGAVPGPEKSRGIQPRSQEPITDSSPGMLPTT